MYIQSLGVLYFGMLTDSGQYLALQVVKRRIASCSNFRNIAELAAHGAAVLRGDGYDPFLRQRHGLAVRHSVQFPRYAEEVSLDVRVLAVVPDGQELQQTSLSLCDVNLSRRHLDCLSYLHIGSFGSWFMPQS